tara:strand:+ start:85 stop:459 length:375 start_codon:yes stop_codon:yes gene_type:complete
MENLVSEDRKSKHALKTLSKRGDFIAASKAEKFIGKSIIVQARPNSLETIRVGYTASKKVGNAVMRNRAKRRMRAAAAETVAQYGTSSTDYVLIGRAKSTCNTKFQDLKFELIYAFKKLSVRKK